MRRMSDFGLASSVRALFIYIRRCSRSSLLLSFNFLPNTVPNFSPLGAPTRFCLFYAVRLNFMQATVADRHGARLVLSVALLGISVSCALFGTATNMRQAVVIRLAQGVFAGAIGVARGCVTVITDPSNEGRAYAILGFCWGFGGAAGAIVGGTCTS